MQLVQAQSFGQGLLSKGLFRQHSRDAVGAFLALGWVQQNELLNLTQLIQKLLGGDSIPGALSLLVEMLQERDAEHAIASVDANFAVGPVIHWSPAQPVSIFEPAKDLLDFLLAGIADGYLLGTPIHAIGEQHGASQAMIDEPLPGSSIEIKLQPPPAILGFDLITDQFLQELSGQPTLDFAANLVFLPAGLWFIQFHGEAPQRLQRFAEAGGQTVQLLAGKRGRILQHAEVFLTVHQQFLSG